MVTVPNAVTRCLLGQLERLESYLGAGSVGEHFFGHRPVNPGTWFTPPAQCYRAPYELRQHLIRAGPAGPHRGTVRQRDRDRRFCTAGACVALGAQLQQAAPQARLLGAGDLAGLQIDQSPAAITGQAGNAHLRLLDAGAEHGFDRVAEDRINGRHVSHATDTRLRPPPCWL